VKLLVTSRERLNLREEWVFDVRGLSFPDDGQTLRLEGYAAIELFEQSARRVGYVQQAADNASIIRICQLVEGIPLALELAASWVRVMPCAEITREIERSLDILTATTRNIPEKHRSMRVAFEQSWNLLSAVEQRVLMRLSVFRGGFSREAAEQVTGASLTLLAGLADKSLLRVDATGRYDLHELLRQYAAEKLEQTPDQRGKVLDQHCEFYTKFLHQHEATIHLSNQAEVLKDLDNLRIAWKRAVQQRNLAALLRAAPSLYWLYHFQSWIDEGAAMFYLAEEALREMSVTDDSRFLLGMMQLFRGYYKLRQSEQLTLPPVDVEAVLALWEGLEERPEMGLPLTRALLRLLGDRSPPARVMAIAQKSLAFARHYNDLSGIAISLTTLAVVFFEAFGEFAEAQRHLEEALAIDRQIGFDLNAGWSEGILGTITDLQGRYEEAKVHSEAWVAHRQAGDISSALDDALHALGNAALELSEDAKARSNFEEGIAVASRLRNPDKMAHGLAGLGIMAFYQGDSTAAGAYYEDGCAHLLSEGMSIMSDASGPENLGFLALMLGHCAHALAHYEATLSLYKDTDYRVPLMCAHSRAGLALLGLADQTRAKPHLFNALHEAAAIGAFQILLEALLGIAQLSIVPSTLAVELLALICEHSASNRYSRTQAKRLLAMMEASLTPDDFMVALERGQALSLEEAVALVEPFHSDLETAQLKSNQQLVDPLSPRELEVLALVAEGLTNQEIARRLFVGVSTVKKHINHIYDKLDVTHRAQAVARARSLNVLA
jgi:DNA-binding CsgD family transcriptional regulator